ncbi:MAG TPA: ABC transporter ATP-binding protein [Candidatus Acidoferrales bacterium]|nr:ABC transporter ATP-binding protein [Candidatus Acidoferrales bacterium]
MVGTMAAVINATITTPAVELYDLVKVYHPKGGPAVKAIDGLSFSVARGAIFGLLGPNGAGKTTTLKILNTLLRPTGGRASVMGFDVATRPLDVRRNISVVLQESAAELFLSVRDNLLTYARFFGMPQDEARRRTDEILERFQIAGDASRKVQDLSGGSRRRVQVGKVFMVHTPVIFLDEFSTGMDALLKRQVMEWLREEAQRGRTIILTTHILSEAEALCDDILIMNQGRQIARGGLHELKLLSEGVYEIAVTFAEMPAGIDEAVAALAPLRSSRTHNTIEVAYKAKDGSVLDAVSALARQGRVLHVEVGGASLEDIFVELLKKEGKREVQHG